MYSSQLEKSRMHWSALFKILKCKTSTKIEPENLALFLYQLVRNFHRKGNGRKDTLLGAPDII